MTIGVLELLAQPRLDLDAIGTWFDSATPLGRIEMIGGIGKKDQARLWNASEGRGGLDLEYVVPDACGVLNEVIHDGHNSLPVFTRFQKRFCRIPNCTDELAGYNEQLMRPFTGPGYFVAREAEAAGEIEIDYRVLPAQKPGGWPEIIDQRDRLGRFVYAGMVDYLRRISAHVTIGRAFRGGKWTENYFLLARRDRWR